MAIEYDLVPGPGSKTNSNNEAQRLVPKIVTRSTVSFKQMAEDISHATSFTEADIVGMMDAIATFASQYLNNSMHVELAGLGTLSLGIACQEDAEGHQPVITHASEVKPHQLRVSKVILTAKPTFMNQLQGPFVRSRDGFPSNAQRERLSPAARRDALLAYLDDNPTISIGKYATLTGLSRKEASAELHFLADPATPDSILSTSGAHVHFSVDSLLRSLTEEGWHR